MPPSLTVVLSATPPVETRSMPPSLIVVLFAFPPVETYNLPPLLIVVVVAVPPSRMVMASFSRMMPLSISPLEMMIAIGELPFVNVKNYLLFRFE